MTDKEILLRGLENLKTKMNNASGGLFQRLENLEIKNGKLKQKNKKLKEQLLVSQTNEETFRLEMEEVTKMLGLDEDTIFDDVKAYVRSLKDNWNKLKKWIYEEHCLYIPEIAKNSTYQLVFSKMQELELGRDSDE